MWEMKFEYKAFQGYKYKNNPKIFYKDVKEQWPTDMSNITPIRHYDYHTAPHYLFTANKFWSSFIMNTNDLYDTYVCNFKMKTSSNNYIKNILINYKPPLYLEEYIINRIKNEYPTSVITHDQMIKLYYENKPSNITNKPIKELLTDPIEYKTVELPQKNKAKKLEPVLVISDESSSDELSDDINNELDSDLDSDEEDIIKTIETVSR
jgi:hypothetical protein